MHVSLDVFSPVNTYKKRNKKNWRWLTFLSLRWDSCSLTVDFISDGCFAAVSALLLACLPSRVFSGPADKPACPMAAGLSHRRGDRLLAMSGKGCFRGLKYTDVSKKGLMTCSKLIFFFAALNSNELK